MKWMDESMRRLQALHDTYLDTREAASAVEQRLKALHTVFCTVPRIISVAQPA